MPSKGWKQCFDDPIPLPDGRELKTLRDAGHYVTSLPAAKQRRAEWQLAAEMLLTVAEGRGPMMFAAIAMLQALNHDEPAPPRTPRRKRAKTFRLLR